MGAAFGYFPESGFNLYFHPEVTPGPNEKPTFDPNLGFENGRKERGIYIISLIVIYYCYCSYACY